MIVQPKRYILYLIFLIASAKLQAFEPIDTVYNTPQRKLNLKERIFNAPIILKTSPTAFLGGGIFPYTAEYRLLIEITTGRTQSDQMGISYLGKSLLLADIENALNTPITDKYKVSGYRIQYAHKFYLITKRMHAPTGFFFGIHSSYSDVHVSEGLNRYYNHAYYDLRVYNINAMVGFQIAKYNRITLEVYGGIGYKNNLTYYHSPTMYLGVVSSKDFGDVYNTHLNVIGGVNLGWAF